MFRQGKHVYVVVNGTRHLIPDRYTMNVLGQFHFHEIKQFEKTMLEKTPKGDGVETLWDKHPNSAVLAVLNRGPRLVKETYHVFTRLLNPSTVYRNGEIFISGRWADDPKYQNMFWVNSVTTVDRTKGYEVALKSLSRFQFNTSVVPYGQVFGEDPRLFALSDGRMFVVICHRFLKMRPELQMAFAELIPHDDRIEVGPLVDIKFKDFPKDDQKNWSPFEYNKTMYLIATTQPHRIVGMSYLAPMVPTHVGVPNANAPRAVVGGENTPASRALAKHVEGRTVACTSMTNFKWAYGDMRGGTPGVHIGNDTILTFFHSSNDPPTTGNVLKTYVFGAYIFDAKPPFAIKAISKEPIVHETMYSGPWAKLPLSYYHIDYIAFPMAFVIENGYVILLYGKQDADAWVAKIELQGLLDSLVPVKTKVEINTFPKA